MAFKLIITSTAELDFIEAINWYTSIQPELSQRFYKAVLKQFADIKRHPTYYSFYWELYRRTLVLHFPYIIIFKIIDKEVIVYSIFYGGRNSELIQKRLP